MKPILRLVPCLLCLACLLSVPLVANACPPAAVGQLNVGCLEAYTAPAVAYVQAPQLIAYNVAPVVLEQRAAFNVGYANYGGGAAFIQTGCNQAFRAAPIRGGRVVQRSVVRGRGVRRGGGAAVVVGVNGY